MIVRLTAEAATVEDADDCRRLHVATALGPGAVDSALRRTGFGSLAEDGTALLDVDVLHTCARAAAATRDWDAQWRAMIDYAGRRAWLSSDGRAVLAHVETTR